MIGSARRALLVPAAFACLLAWQAFAARFTADDSYISFRYARNFVEGHGLVYNIGERVEGYTNFLWVMLLAGADRLFPSITMPVLAEMLGLAAAILTLFVVCRYAPDGERTTGWLAALFLSVHSGFVAWSTAGLETPLFTLFVCAGAFACAAYLRQQGSERWVAVWFALAALTRADGALFFAATLAIVMVVVIANQGMAGLRGPLRMAALFVIIYAPYVSWRYAYYGDTVPNTAYAKAGGGWAHFHSGITYVRTYAREYGVWWWLPAVAIHLLRTRDAWIWYFVGLIAVHLSYVIWLGGDGMAFHRLIIPIAPLMYVVLAAALIGVYRRYVAGPTAQPIRLAGAAVAVASIAWFTARSTVVPVYFPERARWFEPQSELWFPGDGQVHRYQWFGDYFVDRLRIAAQYLDDHAPAGALVASTPAGAIAYYMHHPVIDMLGLTDAHIAHTQTIYEGEDSKIGHEKGDGRYVLSREPEYILLGNVAVLPFPLNDESMAHKLVMKSEHEIWAEPDFRAHYELVCVRLADAGPFQYFTYYRRKHAG